MRFLNKGNPVKIRTGSHKEGYSWRTMRKNRMMELPKHIGRKHNLDEIVEESVTTGKIGHLRVETKQKKHKSSKEFFKELTDIKGIGAKTARDIMAWGDRNKLIRYIKNKLVLPFRDDVAKLLEDIYGED